MSYKQKSNPFKGPANFRNPKNKGTSNFNALEFQMPDLSQIMNKAADGDSKTVDVTNESKTGSSTEGKVDKNTKVESSVEMTANKARETESTLKDLRKQKRANFRAGSDQLKDAAKRIKAQTFTDKQQDRINKREEKRLNKLADKFEKFREKGRLDKDDRTAEKIRQGMKPKIKMDRISAKPIDVGRGDRMTKLMMDEHARDIKKLDEYYKNNPMIADIEQPASRDLIGNPAKRSIGPVNVGGLQNNPDNTGMFKDMNFAFGGDSEYLPSNIIDEDRKNQKGTNMRRQVKTKGEGFPMVNQPQQTDEMGNPIPQPNPKGTMAMGGRPLNSNMLTNDPNNNLDPSKVSAQSENKAQQFNAIASSAGTPTPQYNPYNNEMTGMSFNAGLRKASAEGKLDDNPKFKAAVDNAPAMVNVHSQGPSSFDSLVKKLESEGKSKESATKIAGKVANMKMKGAGSGPTAAQKARAKGTSMHSMDHAHTKVTNKNLKATEKDDAAHMDYLKRDINYDAKHGGSKKQMLDDEKHISKLAGDLKYDTKHHGRKYDNV